MNFSEVCRKRRSVRTYLSKEVPEDLVRQVLDDAHWAPSACNKQPWRVIMVTSPERRRALGTAYALEWFWKAPVILAVCVLPDRAYVRPYDGQNYAWVDGAILMDHITLAAADKGLGTCWIAAFEAATARQILDLPDGVELVAMTPLGWPDETIPPRGERIRQPLTDMVMKETWR